MSLLEAGLTGEAAAGEEASLDAPVEFKAEKFVQVLEVHRMGVSWRTISSNKTKIRRKLSFVQLILCIKHGEEGS